MNKKVIKSFLAIILIFSLFSLTYGSQTEALKQNDDIQSLSVEEQVKLLVDYMSNNEKKKTFNNEINLVGYNVYGFIEVGIANLDDEKFKDDILAIPGIDSKLVRIVDFIIDPYPFATEPPPGYGYET